MLSQQKVVSISSQKPGSVRVLPAKNNVTNKYARESRIGRNPVPIPKGVSISLDGQTLVAKGPNGTLQHTFLPVIKVEQVEGSLKFSKLEDSRFGMSQHGLSRTLAHNMVTGVSAGFSKKLELVGTGYRASLAGKQLTLNVGYSKPRVLPVPDGLNVTVEKNTSIVISGANKVLIGDFAATVRRQRPPEPYKGKGIRYAGEVIKLKEGKASGKKGK